MSCNRISGHWKRLTGRIKEEWGKLIDDELTRRAGHRRYFLGEIQEYYNVSQNVAEHQLHYWEQTQMSLYVPRQPFSK